MRIPDELIIKFFTLATNLSNEEVERQRVFLAGGGNPKEAKERLARQIALELHDPEAADRALAGWQKVHSLRQLPDTMPLLVDSGMAQSKTKARRLIGDNAVRIDGKKVESVEHQVLLAAGSTLVVQVGRQKFLGLLNN